MNKEKCFRFVPEAGYLQNGGVDVMAFDDFYPGGHQSGVSVIMHGNRVASNGDVRFTRPSGMPGPVPEQLGRTMDAENNSITASMRIAGLPCDPADESAEDSVNYTVTAKCEGNSVAVTVDFERPVPDRYADSLCFNLELFPGALFGKPWMMDGRHGVFPTQPNGPTSGAKGEAGGEQALFNDNVKTFVAAEPYAAGRRLVVRPDDPYNRLVIKSEGAELKLYDGRMNHNSGWFIVSSGVTAGASKNAVKWLVTPNAVDGWLYPPVVQASQVGYHPEQPKVAVIELDKRDAGREAPALYKITEGGDVPALQARASEWGRFLRYNYLKFDFSEVKEEGLYKIRYGESESQIFRIARDVYDRGVWQPVLEYFLPVQMCHMRINEKYRVWHGLCHDDDAQMAPINHRHFDGYWQGPSTMSDYKPGDVVPGLNVGGWHDAGDDDLRIESQGGEVYILSMAYEAFNVFVDDTTVDQLARVVEIHQPDGKNDILQQIEHGVLSVVGAYKALGRLYRGIITNDKRQYVLLGDPALQTDNIIGNADDRWVFTEDNPPREFTAAAHLAAAARALCGFNDGLARQALDAAREIFSVTPVRGAAVAPDADTEGGGAEDENAGTERARIAKAHAAAELLLATGDGAYKEYLLSEAGFIAGAIDRTGWFVGRAEKAIGDAGFSNAIRAALPGLKERLQKLSAETPYGIPYRPHIWGAGWEIQRLGFQYYYLHDAYPDIFGPAMVFDALDFILGRHPGSNTMSFASGVGAKSALIAYGWNRADWSFVPGGVISGTALIRPDFPELLEFPYLWQQTEYVLGGGSSHYMFLVLAARRILGA